jgi:glutathione S-transferase
MALTIYGSEHSRTMRVLWMAAELGLDYTHVALAFDNPKLKTPEFLQINPAGAIPTIVDDGFALSESLAINLYLAKKYGRSEKEPIYPSGSSDEADTWRWTIWAQGHLEPWVQKDLLLRDLIAAIGDHAGEAIAQSLKVLDRTLADRDWLVAGHFTVADLNVAAVLSPSRSGKLELSAYPNVATWLKRSYDRPAAINTRKRFFG